MKANSPHFLLDKPALYRVRVHGRLAAHWADTLGGMSITVRQNTSGEPLTTLTGVLVDQASLMGVLVTLYEMGYTLLDLKRHPVQVAGDETDGRVSAGTHSF